MCLSSEPKERSVQSAERETGDLCRREPSFNHKDGRRTLQNRDRDQTTGVRTSWLSGVRIKHDETSDRMLHNTVSEQSCTRTRGHEVIECQRRSVPSERDSSYDTSSSALGCVTLGGYVSHTTVFGIRAVQANAQCPYKAWHFKQVVPVTRLGVATYSIDRFLGHGSWRNI